MAPLPAQLLFSWGEQLGCKTQCKLGQGVLGQPRAGGKTEVWKAKGMFAGSSLCGPQTLELNVIGVRLDLVMEQVMQTRDWKKHDDWETGQEGKRERATEQTPSRHTEKKGQWDPLATEAQPSSRHHREEVL